MYPYFFNPLNSKLPGREGWKRVEWGEETVDESAYFTPRGAGAGRSRVAFLRGSAQQISPFPPFFFGSLFTWGSTQIRPIDSLRRPLPTQYLKIDTRDHADLFVTRSSPPGRRGDHLPSKACITGSLWAKRGELGISREVRDEERRNIKRPYKFFLIFRLYSGSSVKRFPDH